jgi:hypothetical protein
MQLATHAWFVAHFYLLVRTAARHRDCQLALDLDFLLAGEDREACIGMTWPHQTSRARAAWATALRGAHVQDI